MKATLFHHLVALSTALTFIASASWVAAADNAGGMQSAWLIVGDSAPDFTSLPIFTFSDGQLKPAAEAAKGGHRLVVFCDSDGEDLAADVSGTVERIAASTFPGVQLYLVIPATPDDVSIAIAKQTSLTGKAFQQTLPDALLIAADREAIRETFLIQVGKHLPGVELSLLPQDPDDRPVIPAILIGKGSTIEWAGDIAWAGRPAEQLVAGSWDRSVTEMACRLSKALFFDMKFLVDVSLSEFNKHHRSKTESRSWATRLWGPYIDALDPSIALLKMNYSKPLLRCIEAEAKGERDEALRLLAECTLKVNCRLLSVDQYWKERPAVSFLPGLQTTLAANAMVTAEISDSDLKARLAAQRPSLGRWVALLNAAEAGDLEKVDSLIAALPEDEVENNAIGILRCRIETCLASDRPEAVNSLRQILKFDGTLRGFYRSDEVINRPNFRLGSFRLCILTVAQKRLFEAKPISNEMRAFIRELKNGRSSKVGGSRRRVDTLIRDDK